MRRALFSLNFSLVFLTASLCIVSGPASADPATHKLALAAKTIGGTDCGSGSCVPSCRVKGSLAVMPNGPVSTPELNVLFWYETGHVDAGEAALSLQFAALKRGKPDTTTAWALGYACRDLKIIRTEVECLGRPDGKCSGFYKVTVPAVPDLHLLTVSVEAK